MDPESYGIKIHHKKQYTMLMELVTTVKAMQAELQKKEDDLEKKEMKLRS